ncbi:MAG: nucleotidyltransferase family protein [Lysobacterales bacterium]
MPNRIDQYLARLLKGDRPTWPAAVDAGAMVSAAERHGIAALLHERLSAAGGDATVPAGLIAGIARAAQTQTRRSLLLEAETRRVVAALNAAGYPLLLLKGSALAWWLYPAPGLRTCNDIDLLVAPAHAQQAREVLAGLGYDPAGPPLAGDLCSFQTTLSPSDRTRPRLEVDLHWALSNAPVFAFRFDFDELYAARTALPGLDAQAFGLGPVHAFLHAAMHRVQNFVLPDGERLKWLYDLDLLGLGFTPSQWQQLLELARERGLAGCCRDGLLAAAGVFGAVAPPELLDGLQRAAVSELIDLNRMHRPAYIEWANFRALPGAGRKLRWLGQRLWPSAAYRRARYGGGIGHALASRLSAAWRRLLRSG